MHFVKVLTDRLVAERSKFAKERQESTLIFGTCESVVYIESTSLEHVIDVIESFVMYIMEKKCIGTVSTIFAMSRRSKIQRFVEKCL